DMLLQRIGRLWRHKDTVRPNGTKREAYILTPTLEMVQLDPKKAYDKTASVYSHYVLYRSMQIWSKINSIILHEQIRWLIETTYKEKREQGIVEYYKKQLKEECEKLSQLALIGISRGGKTLSEKHARTRYSDQETVDVLLIKSLHSGGG